MSAERFFDDLARTLAEPMPRRGVLRLVGASPLTLSVPGCDKAFCDALYASCERTFSEQSKLKGSCDDVAATYCIAVKHTDRADRAFEDAQREACFCC